MRPLLAALVSAAILAGCQTTGQEKKPQPAPRPEETRQVKPEPSPVDELFARLNGLIEGAKLDEASETLKSAQQLAPGDPRAAQASARLADAFAQRAQILTNEGKLVEAQAELRKALELDQANSRARSVARQLAQAWADRADKLRAEGKPSDAQGAVLNALQLDRENAAANRLAKRIAQDYALRAANLLDEGKEPEARASLDAARQLDTKNELANTLYGSLTVDPEQEFGAKFFRYTVKPGDKLSRIAEVYLKDQYKFYLLARYNGIAVPRGLKAGQVIKVPGKPLPEHGEDRSKPKDRPEDKAKDRIKLPVDDSRAKTAYEECKRLMKAGDNERAYERCREAASLSPTTREYQADTERLRKELVQIYDRKARDCYRRQELDCCISSWDKVRQLEPDYEPAPRERDRCVRLRDILKEK
jgi:tetratricopeptide (TPR) repeat protein